ncbi:MAG: hypothetical protein K8I30_08130 [Anaerolineae bacterium]|nr:hypothetical protein [Anaerolineae bacterium]MCL4218230.1 hypothetical protein [Candidatus Hydrogenedentota bacterium]
MSDEMFFTADMKSLRRGKRRTGRTDVCRPCLTWPKDEPEMAWPGVIINVSPYGVCVRMMETLPSGTAVMVQLMRDEEFQEPLATPIEGLIVRIIVQDDGFFDHGIQLNVRQIRRAESRPQQPVRQRQRPQPLRRKKPSRMHTIDLTVGDSGIRRTER